MRQFLANSCYEWSSHILTLQAQSWLGQLTIAKHHAADETQPTLQDTMHVFLAVVLAISEKDQQRAFGKCSRAETQIMTAQARLGRALSDWPRTCRVQSQVSTW